MRSSEASRTRLRLGISDDQSVHSINIPQFAWVSGARAIATTSTAEKAERLKALGASEVINYVETPNWDVKSRELTGGMRWTPIVRQPEPLLKV